MLVKPNQTVIEGKICAIRPAEGGYGTEVLLEVDRNLSQSRENDFLRPEPGKMLRLFAGESPTLEIGQQVQVQARLLAGPSGGRAILEKVHQVT